jgi:hypothetical protein
MIEVFITNVQKTRDAGRMKKLLWQHFPGYEISFDLEDCDKVLRIAGKEIEHEKVITTVQQAGFICITLE